MKDSNPAALPPSTAGPWPGRPLAFELREQMPFLPAVQFSGGQATGPRQALGAAAGPGLAEPSSGSRRSCWGCHRPDGHSAPRRVLRALVPRPDERRPRPTCRPYAAQRHGAGRPGERGAAWQHGGVRGTAAGERLAVGGAEKIQACGEDLACTGGSGGGGGVAAHLAAGECRSCCGRELPGVRRSECRVTLSRRLELDYTASLILCFMLGFWRWCW